MLKGKKTYITGTIAVLTAAGAYLSGDATAMQAAQMAFNAVMIMTARNAIGRNF